MHLCAFREFYWCLNCVILLSLPSLMPVSVVWFQDLRRQVLCWLTWCQKQQNIRSRKMRNKCCLKVNGEGSEFKATQERGRGVTGPLVLLWLPPHEPPHWEITAHQLVQPSAITQVSPCISTVLCAPSSRDVCTHDHIWFSPREILGGGQRRPVLFWLMGEWGSEKGPNTASQWQGRFWKWSFLQTIFSKILT